MNPQYGNAQILVAIIFLLISLVLAVVFVVVAVHSGREIPLGRVQEVAYWIRKRWLAFLVALCVVVVGVSWVTLPYATGSGAHRTTVNVAAGQFYWALKPPRVPVGTAVRFQITSPDVNHGFGLYDPQGHLIAEAQAMPGYTNTLDVTFTRAGRYVILCMEYCGVGHHLMEGTFTVLPAPAGRS